MAVGLTNISIEIAGAARGESLLAIAAFIVGAVSAFIAMLALRQQARDNLIYKQAEISAAASRIDDDIQHLLLEIMTAKKAGVLDHDEAADAYFNSLWRRRADSWWQFRNGLIPLTMAAPWFRRRALEFQQNERVLGVAARDGWHLTRHRFAAYPDFVNFIDLLVRHGRRAAAADDLQQGYIERLMVRYHHRFRKQRAAYRRARGPLIDNWIVPPFPLRNRQLRPPKRELTTWLSRIRRGALRTMRERWSKIPGPAK